MNILRTFVYLPHVSISVGQVPRVRTSSLCSHPQAYTCGNGFVCRWRPVHPRAVVDMSFLKSLSGVPASTLPSFFSSLPPTHSILSNGLQSSPAPELQPLCGLFQKAFLNHFSLQWPPFLSATEIWFVVFVFVFYLQLSFWTVIIYFSIVHTALCVSVSALQIASSLKSGARLVLLIVATVTS